ncbi:hypothetical protein BD779DRAFT_1681228 [Infundibulicybe gibba]|nr:hypothetical protein BD779DRAFT_1681228 [Infundibulicybe gibba]
MIPYLGDLEPTVLFQYLVDAKTTNYLVAAAVTLLVFDHLLTTPQEVKLIWQSPWSLTSSLYKLCHTAHTNDLAIRIAFGIDVETDLESIQAVRGHIFFIFFFTELVPVMLREIDSDKSHRILAVVFHVFYGISASILVNTVDVILALRVWILYEKNRKILWFFVILISAEFLAMISLAVVTVRNLNAFIHFG